MRAFVLDGDSRAALAITRSLGRRGIEVIVASEDDRCLAGCSRYRSTILTYPCPRRSPNGFREWLLLTLRSMPDVTVYCCSDVTTSIVGKHRLGLPPQATALLPPQSSLETALDKSATLELASNLGVPAPKSVEIYRKEPIDSARLPFDLPAAVKAAQSDVPQRLATIYAHDSRELSLAVTEVLRDSQSALVQEVATGEGTAVFALFDSGKPLATFAHRRLREKPPWGGVSVLSEAIEPPPEMLDHALRMLEELRWHGVAMVEFKRSGSGSPLLMEINPRFWGSLELAVKAGVDFPYLAFKLAAGEETDAPRPKRAINRWVLGQVDSLITSVRDRVPGRSRILAPFSHLLDLRYGLGCEIERISDPGPAIYEYSSWLRLTARKATSGKKGDPGRCGKIGAFGG